MINLPKKDELQAPPPMLVLAWKRAYTRARYPLGEETPEGFQLDEETETALGMAALGLCAPASAGLPTWQRGQITMLGYGERVLEAAYGTLDVGDVWVRSSEAAAVLHQAMRPPRQQEVDDVRDFSEAESAPGSSAGSASPTSSSETLSAASN